MVVIETNSCPSGQKSFPLLNEGEEKNGYQYLIDYTFKPYLEECEANGKMIEGALAVVFDKVLSASGTSPPVVSQRECVYHRMKLRLPGMPRAWLTPSMRKCCWWRPTTMKRKPTSGGPPIGFSRPGPPMASGVASVPPSATLRRSPGAGTSPVLCYAGRSTTELSRFLQAPCGRCQDSHSQPCGGLSCWRP